MNNKLQQWISLQVILDQHAENARAAVAALDTKDKLVNRHLLRIAQREDALSDFVFHISESQAFYQIGEE